MANSDDIMNTLKNLTCVKAGWAFGVPEDGRQQWLELVTAAVQQPKIENTAPGYDRHDIYSFQDDLLIAIQDGEPLKTEILRKLPPWRAFLIACVADKAGTGLEHGTLDQLNAEAKAVTGAGTLGEWWKR